MNTEQQTVEIVVYGEAKPAGSKRAFVNPKTGQPIITDSSGKAGRTWRQDVKQAAHEAMNGTAPLEGPLDVTFTFYRQRPLSHFGTGRNAGTIKDSAPLFPATRPDLLKLARSAEDALTGTAYRDDAQIVTEMLFKRFGEPARCEIAVKAA